MNSEQLIKVYIYREDSMHSPAFVIKADPEIISSVILHTKNAPKVVFDNMDDYTEITTITGFIDTCKDQIFLKTEILPVLIPMQQYIAKPINIIPEYNMTNLSWDNFKKWINEEFNTSL